MLKKIFKRGLLSFAVVMGMVFCTNHAISTYSALCYSDVREVPENEVGLLLGTIKHLKNGQINWYYEHRLAAAVDLYHQGKIKYILVSGDNSREEYNEPETFQADLIAAGIPESRIYLDYAGFRTLDSVVRCHRIFGQSSFTIISQPFHNERALFLADAHGLNAIGFNAASVSLKRGLKVVVREYFARFKAFLDVYVLHTSPKFLGEPIKIG